MPNPVFWGKNKKKYFKLSSAETFLPRVLSVKTDRQADRELKTEGEGREK